MASFINAEAVALVLFLAVLNNRLVEYFVTPFFERQKWDKQWLMYVALLTGILIGVLSGANLFPAVFMAPVVGIVITAILIGGGSNLIHDILDRPTASS